VHSLREIFSFSQSNQEHLCFIYTNQIGQVTFLWSTAVFIFCTNFSVSFRTIFCDIGSETLKQGIAKSLGEMESLDWLVPPMLQKADSILAERNLEQF
jgi:hypothetical protein